MHIPDSRDDRRAVDGESGRGDMLGGLTTGAGGQLGLPDDAPADHDRVVTVPIVPTRHTNDGTESETDPARPDDGANGPA
jgi:hypothetical protein